MYTPSRLGRPPIADRSQNKSHLIQVRVTEGERLKLEQVATMNSSTLSDVLRKCIQEIPLELVAHTEPDNIISVSIDGVCNYISINAAKSLLKQLTEKLLN